MKRTIEILLRLVAPPVRLAALILAALAAGGAWAATYVMSNADGSALYWDGGYNWNSGNISFTLSTPSGVYATSTFPTSGNVALTCISISSRSNGSNSSLDHVVMNAANGKSYTSSRVEVLNSAFTTTLDGGSTGSGQKTINIYFDSAVVDVTSALTLATYTSSGSTGQLGSSVVTRTSGSGWKPAMRIYGTSIDTATTSTPVLLVDANGDGNGTADDPNTVEWLGLAQGNSQSATQGGARLAVTIEAGNLWANNITDSFDAQEGTFLAPSATVVTPEAFSASALDEVVAELGLDATQTAGLSTALSKGLYNGQGVVRTQTVTISGLTIGQNYTLYLAASGFTYNNNAKPTPYVALTGFATGTTPVIAKTSVSATGWTESANLSAAGTAGELTLFRIRNLYANSSGQVTLSLSDGTHGNAGFNMVALAQTKTPKYAAVVGGVKALSSIAIDSSNLVSGFPISSATIGEGTLIQSGSVVIGNSGMTLDFTSNVKPRFTAFVKASNLPVSSGRLISWSSGAHAPFVQKTATGFEQKYLDESNGNVDSGSSGTGAWTHDADEHWLAVVHNRADGAGDYETGGTYTYIDGERICSSTGLKWGGYTFKSITIGGAKVNDADVANGMSVSKVYLCSEALTQAQMATVTAALNKGWTIAESTGLVLAGTNVELPDSTETVTAKIWINADGTYFFVKSGSIPSSDLHSSGGVALPSAVTVDDEAGLICANDGSVIIRDAGIQIPLAETLPYLTVMMKVSNIPSSASRLLGWAIDYKSVSGSLENFLSYTGTQFEQHYYYNTGVAKTTYGTSAWTRDANEHWIATTYVPNNSMDGCSQTTRGTRTYLDGTQIIEDTGFYFTDAQTSKILIGGLSLNGGNPATGMVVKDVMILADALTSAQIATVTAALNKGWAPVNAAGTTLSGTNLELPDSTAHLTGTISIASDGSYSVSVSSGTTTLPSGAKVAEVAAGATVYVTTSTAPANLEEAIAGGYALSATLTVPETVDGTIALVDSNGNEATGATSTYENGVRSFTGTAPANPTYTGSAWWWDYEFDEDSGVDHTNGRQSMPNTGNADNDVMYLEATSQAFYTDADDDGNREIYFQQTPWRNASFSSLKEMTAVMYCQPGNYGNTVLVGFGSTTVGGKKAIALVTGDNPANGDMKLVLTDGEAATPDGQVTVLAPLKAVDATTSKHLYAFVMDRITENDIEKTRVRVYLDGKVKAIHKHSGTLSISDGFQLGSFHGGVHPNGGINTGFNKYPESGNSGTLDFLRVFNGSLSDSAMAALADAYKYESAHGAATRDAVSAAASWVATDVWTQTMPEEADAVQDAPNADTNVTLSKGGSSAVEVALNLESDSNYESLTLTKEAGATGTLKITSAYGNNTSGKLVAAETSILVDTVIPAGRANLGITSIGDGVTLTVDPFSGMGNYAILSELEQLGPGGVFEDIVISMAILGEGASVVLDSTGVLALAQYGFTAALTYNESNQSYTFSITRSAAANVDIVIRDAGTTWIANEVAMPAQTEMPSTYTGTVTIYNITDNPATIDASFAGGNLTVAASLTEFDKTYPTSPVVLTGTISTLGTVAFNGAVTLGGTGQTVASAVTGSGVVTVNGSVNLTGSIANTIAGAGTITLSSLSQTLTFGAWMGTVVLPALTADQAYNFNNYGVSGSTVRLTSGFSTGWLADAAVNPAIEIPSDQSFALGAFSPSFANAFAALKGDGTFAITAVANQANDLANVSNWGSGYDHYSAYFRIGDVSGFHGSITTTSDVGVVLGSSKPSKNTPGGKILVYGTVTVGETATWTAPNGVLLADAGAVLAVPSGATVPVPTTSVANSYVKETGDTTKTYAVDAYKTVTITGSNMTATRTDVLGTDIKDGDTITFTVAPAAGHVVTGVTATPEGGSPETLTANNGVYSYVVNGNVTIAVSVVAVAEPRFDVYYAGYGQAKTVTVAASDYVEGSVYTLQVGSGAAVTGVYDGTAQTVTFSDVEGFTPGTAVNYTITVSGAAAGTKSGTVTAAAPTVSGWVSETKTTIGTASATGTWSPDAPTFGDAASAALSGETTFTANSQASGKVTLTTVVKFGNEADSTIEIGADAKAAIKVENNSFKIWTKRTSEGGTGATADWLTVSGATPNLEDVSTVVFTFDTDAKTFTVSVDGAALYYGESNANTSFAFASDGVAISSVAYKGAGSFTSLTGAYATTDVTTSVDGKQVVVANSFISAYLDGKTVAEAAAALNPDATDAASNPEAFAAGGNGINYFKCYALGLDPKKTDDKPIVDVTVEDGKYVFTVKHPIFDSEGEITGYEVITPADNVTTTVALKYGTDANTQSWESAAGTSFAPNALPFGENNNVIYYKAKVSISAK